MAAGQGSISEETEKVFVVNRVRVDDKSGISVSLKGSTSAFGEAITVSPVPIIQSAPAYGYMPNNFRGYTAESGSAGVSGNEFYVDTGATIYGYGAVQSFRSVNYKAGQGAVGRLTARFSTGGVADSWQGAGLFTITDELSFGFNGTTFGIWHRYNGAVEIRKLTFTVGSGGATDATVFLNGTSYTIPLTAGTTETNAAEVAAYLTANQSAFNCTQNGSDVICVALSDGAKSGTYSFSHASASASWSQTSAGVTKTSSHIPQSTWNIDTVGWLDPTKGNVYQVQYQYLGYGAITFSIEDPQTGQINPVHVIRYSNSATQTSISNPSMHIGIYAASVGSTTSISVYSASVAAFVQGISEFTRNSRSVSNVNTSVGTTLTNILAIRNRRSVNGYINQVEVEPLQLTVFTESTKGATIEIRGNPTFSGTTNYAFSGTNLVVEYDTTANTPSGGVLLATYVIPGNSSQIIDLTSLRLRFPPTLVVSIGAKVNSGASNTVGVSIVYYEDV